MSKEKKSGSSIKKGAVIAYITVFVEIVLGFVYTPWMLREIGADNYALYTLGTSLMTFVLLDFGLSNSVTRFVSKYRAEGKQQEADNILGMIYRLYLLFDAIIFVVLLVLYFFLDRIYVGLSPAELNSFRVVYLILAVFSVSSFPFTPVNGVLNSYEKFVPLKLSVLVQKLGTVGTIFLILSNAGLLGWTQEQCLFALVIANAVWGIGVTLVKFSIVRIQLPIRANMHFFEKKQFKDLFAFSIWITIIQLFERLFFLITPTILGVVSNAMAIATFGLASQLEAYANTMACSINGMFMPKVTRMIQNDDNDGIERLMITVGRFQSVILGLIICGFTVVGYEFVGYWASEEFDYMIVWICAMMMFVPMLFTKTQSIAGVVAEAKNEMRSQAIVYIVLAILYVITVSICAHFWGALGACISLAAVSVIRMVAIDVIYFKKLNLNVGRFLKETLLPLVPISAITIVLSMLIIYWIPNTFSGSMVMFLLRCLIVGVIYCVALFLFGLKKDEKKRILSILKREL